MSQIEVPEASPRLRQVLLSALAQPQSFGRDFYQRLFELAPAARALFPAQLEIQEDKLARSLLTMVETLDQAAAMRPLIEQLGARHVQYGASPLHYLAVGEALNDTFIRRAGELFDQELRAQWQRFYGWVVSAMLQGAQMAHELRRDP